MQRNDWLTFFQEARYAEQRADQINNSNHPDTPKVTARDVQERREIMNSYSQEDFERWEMENEHEINRRDGDSLNHPFSWR